MTKNSNPQLLDQENEQNFCYMSFQLMVTDFGSGIPED